MRVFPPKKPTIAQPNFHHLVQDILWFGLALPATTRFLSVYAVRVGAGPDELGWLTSLPAILVLLTAAMSKWWMRRFPSSTRALFWPAFGFRLAFLLPVLTPFFPAEWQPAWLILSLALPALPQGVASVVFLIMMREAVDERQITPLLSRRSLALNIAVGLSGLLLGLWLDHAPFPMNYQAMFIVAFVMALISLWHVMQIHVQPAVVTQLADMPISGRNPWRTRPFLQVGFIAAIMHLAFFSVLPLSPLYLVDNLGATEGFMAIFALFELGAGALVSTITNQLIRRIGSRNLIALAMVGTAAGAVIIALAPHLYWTLPASAILGACWTVAGIGLFSYFTENTPQEDINTFSTAYMQVVYLAIFLAPMIGMLLSKTGINLPHIILFGALLRVMAAVLIQPRIFVGRQWYRVLAQ
ncbi:MAG: MFS transporter [Anaerolineaceae bacterium]|nr:MFS transporter [Anaerolineaceae bacterium]